MYAVTKPCVTQQSILIFLVDEGGGYGVCIWRLSPWSIFKLCFLSFSPLLCFSQSQRSCCLLLSVTLNCPAGFSVHLSLVSNMVRKEPDSRQCRIEVSYLKKDFICAVFCFLHSFPLYSWRGWTSQEAVLIADCRTPSTYIYNPPYLLRREW